MFWDIVGAILFVFFILPTGIMILMLVIGLIGTGIQKLFEIVSGKGKKTYKDALDTELLVKAIRFVIGQKKINRNILQSELRTDWGKTETIMQKLVEMKVISKPDEFGVSSVLADSEAIVIEFMSKFKRLPDN